MKPTSLIFLAMSLVLLFGGFVTCKVAESMAEKRDIKIYDQNFDENGDTVYSYNLSSPDISKLTLTFRDADISFHQTTKESYIELKNFNVNSYATKLSGGMVTVDGTVGKLSSFVDFSDGGIKFKGLRYFLFDNPDASRKKTVDVYLAPDCSVKTITVTTENGDVNFDNLKNDFDYFVVSTGADVSFNSVESGSVAEIKVTNGNVDLTGTLVNNVSVTSTDGDVTIKTGGKYLPDEVTFRLSSAEGSVVYNEQDQGGSYKVVSPIQKSNIKVDSTTGNIYIFDNK